VFTARYGLDLYIYFRLFLTFKGLRYNQGEFADYEHSDYYIYHQFNIEKFVWIWEQTAIISLYSIN